jgi:hypothetical protein
VAKNLVSHQSPVSGFYVFWEFDLREEFSGRNFRNLMPVHELRQTATQNERFEIRFVSCRCFYTSLGTVNGTGFYVLLPDVILPELARTQPNTVWTSRRESRHEDPVNLLI